MPLTTEWRRTAKLLRRNSKTIERGVISHIYQHKIKEDTMIGGARGCVRGRGHYSGVTSEENAGKTKFAWIIMLPRHLLAWPHPVFHRIIPSNLRKPSDLKPDNSGNHSTLALPPLPPSLPPHPHPTFSQATCRRKAGSVNSSSSKLL